MSPCTSEESSIYCPDLLDPYIFNVFDRGVWAHEMTGRHNAIEFNISHLFILSSFHKGSIFPNCFSSVWVTYDTDCIQSFSDAGYLILGRPICEHTFFEQAVLKHCLSQSFLQITRLMLQTGDFARCRLALSIPRQALLTVNVYVDPETLP